MNKTLDVVFIWHMHQPDYRDPATEKFKMPWVFLHAVRDYGEMVRIAQECKAKVTFNLVPTLLEQLASYIYGNDFLYFDEWLWLLFRNPADMTAVERQFATESFFSVDYGRHIAPYAKYANLKSKKKFSDQDLRDLQVWFLLSWAGHYLRRESECVKNLFAKGGGFTEKDKYDLFVTYFKKVLDVISAYNEAEQKEDIEISFTPYAHPILPLLCNNAIATAAKADARLPSFMFKHPADAVKQVQYGKDVINCFLGEKPRGMWPAEGAVSEEALSIIQREGVTWVATDEEILRRSANTQEKYKPYSYRGLPILFRDRTLSDHIGFQYSKWEPDQAVTHFVAQLKNIRNLPDSKVVTIVLDGENCWEYYRDNGYPFLSQLYRRIQDDSDLNMITATEAIERHSATSLEHIAPGSWIGGNFDVWIGGREENKAWDYLARVREDFSEVTPDLMRAEGSDWFWWFGDHYQTAQADTFDALFRGHLRAAYERAGKKVPGFLYKPVRRKI